MNFILVGLGGFLGSIARYGFYLIEHTFPKQSFPYATFIINILGSLIAGMIFSTLSKNLSLLFLVGFIGSFTTFSTFSLDSLLLIQQGKYTVGFFYLLLSINLGIAATWLGMKMTSL